MVLGLGLKFLPAYYVPPRTIISSLLQSLDTLCYRLKLSLFFKNNDSYKIMIPSLLKKTNKFNPTIIQENIINEYKTKCIETINATDWSMSQTPLQKLIRITMMNIKNRKDIVIKPADKNLGTCIMSIQDYVKMCNEHVSDIKSYEVYKGSNIRFRIEFKELSNILTKYQKDKGRKRGQDGKYLDDYSELYLSLMQLDINPSDLKVSKLYCLPKMHKILKPGQPIPGRPIVSSINSVTYFASKYLHNYFVDLANKLPSICKSSINVLHKLNNLTLADDCLLLCADVKSLYPSIPIEYGIKAIKEMLIRYKMPEINFHLEILHWVLTNNIFEFNSKYYRQIQGTAMGTPVAVTYANIVLSYLEEDCLNTIKPILYMRYIDDLFVICQTKDVAINIISTFNSKCDSIQLDETTIDREGIFLDLHISLTSNKIITKVYQKTMNKYLYIPGTSEHPKHMIKNMIRQEIKRYRLYCSDNLDFFKVKNEFKKRLLVRGYTDSYLTPIFIEQFDRNKLFKDSYKNNKNNNIKRGPIITISTPQFKQKKDIKSLFSLPKELVECWEYNKCFGNNNVIIGKRNYPSIGRNLIHRPLSQELSEDGHSTINTQEPRQITKKRKMTLFEAWDLEIFNEIPKCKK